MKIVGAEDYPSIPRRVVRVVMNPDEPKWVHGDGSTHTAAAPVLRANSKDAEKLAVATIEAFKAEFRRNPEPGEWCKDCHLNHHIVEQTFTRDELEVGLNKWGNPAHDDQQVVSSRAKTWDELYAEVRERLAKDGLPDPLDLTMAPREGPPSLVEEVEEEFDLVESGEAHMGDGVTACCRDGAGRPIIAKGAHQRYRVLHYGKEVGTFVAIGTSTTAFNKDMLFKYGQVQVAAGKQDDSRAKAEAIVG